MSEPSDCDTPLKATFKFKLNGETVSIDTVGQAYRFMTVTALRSASENAMLTVQATNALRALFARANLLS